MEVFTYAIATVAVGKAFTGKESFVTAQFSLPYVVAACLVDGAMGPEQLTEARLRDSAISGMAAKVKITIDGALQGMYPDKTASRVKINLGGRARVREAGGNAARRPARSHVCAGRHRQIRGVRARAPQGKNRRHGYSDHAA